MIEGRIGKPTMGFELATSEARKNGALVVSFGAGILVDCESEVCALLEERRFKRLFLFKAGILERGISEVTAVLS